MKGRKEPDTLAGVYAEHERADREDRQQAETILDALKRNEEKSKTRKEKIEDCKNLAGIMARPQNQKAAMVFVATSVAMFTLPIIALLVSTYVVVPMLSIDHEHADMVNAGVAMCTAIGVIIAYIVYAFYEDSLSTALDYPRGLPNAKENHMKATMLAARNEAKQVAKDAKNAKKAKKD
jgi:hypothetical protein